MCAKMYLIICTYLTGKTQDKTHNLVTFHSPSNIRSCAKILLGNLWDVNQRSAKHEFILWSSWSINVSIAAQKFATSMYSGCKGSDSWYMYFDMSSDNTVWIFWLFKYDGKSDTLCLVSTESDITIEGGKMRNRKALCTKNEMSNLVTMEVHFGASCVYLYGMDNQRSLLIESVVRTVERGKSLMTEWLEQASQWHEVYCHDLEVVSLNPGRVKLGVHSTSLLSCTWARNVVIMSWLNMNFTNYYILKSLMASVWR